MDILAAIFRRHERHIVAKYRLKYSPFFMSWGVILVFLKYGNLTFVLRAQYTWRLSFLFCFHETRTSF